MTISYAKKPAYLSALARDHKTNRALIQHLTTIFNCFLMVQITGKVLLHAIFVWLYGCAVCFLTTIVSGKFFLCLLAVSHTLCKYLTVVLTLVATVDKLMPQ